MKKLLLLAILILGCLWGLDVLAQSWSFNCSGNNCFKAGVDAAGNTIGKSSGIITGKGISQAVQDVIKYFLTFLTLICVVYIMWAGAQMLLFPSNEESGEKTKKIIISVIVGLAIIWFAWWIVTTIFYILNNKAVVTNMIPQAVAETQIRSVDFNTYRNKILALKTRINGEYNPQIINELTVLVDGAYDHLPDRADLYANQQLYDRVKTAIADYNLHREEIDLGQLQNALDAFLEQSRTFTIQGQVSAAPNSGDAPLSVTLEGKNIVDSSDTTIPENNYVWWLRTPEGSKILGRGKTINYVFNDEGTYTVNLTVNSASKNQKGFNDVINFEDQVTIDVGQPKAKFIIFFNDQLASDSIKIPLKEADTEIIIDARQTRFSSGYTISKTEWDFGNGATKMNDGGPQMEFQKFRQGEHAIKLKLTRNDGDTFEKNIILKVGDPIASISASTLKPNKGEKVIFQAKKINQEGVTFSWEIRKEGSESVLYAANGPRTEYSFRDIGNYAVSLISAKGDARDKETLQIYIDSRPPVVRFDATQENNETPNIYLFDGTATYDPDYPDDTSIKYEWFINDQPVELSETNSQGSRGNYTFTEKGTYQIELQATDTEGKIGSFKKTVEIKNLLSVQVNIRPQIARQGQRILLSASAPDAEIFEWSISNLDPVVKETGRHSISFNTAGTYNVILKVTNSQGEINTVRRKIYVVNGEEPFAIIGLTSKSILAGTENGACDGNDATIVDRVAAVSFTGDQSINLDGKTGDLSYFWKVGLNKTSTQRNLSHTFDELGCEQITLTVTDKKTGTSHTVAEWVKVVNIAPRFSDIDVKVENIDMDPMKVDLAIQGAKDPDGAIRSYTWYYGTTPDGDDPLGFRITTKPETSFVLPKITGRYYFFVILEDSNGLRIDTKNISDAHFSTPDLLINQNLAAPIIDLVVENNEVAYGDEVVFRVNVKNALEKDISEGAEYRWDVDGDGFYDIKTTVPTYTFKYTNPGEYKPKVKVTHKGLSATKSAEIKVTNRLIPDIDVQIIGDKIIAYNTSSGIYQSASWFADDKKISENKEYLYYDATNQTFPSNLKLEISDGKETQETTVAIARNPAGKILVKKITNPLVLLGNTGSVSELPDEITWSDANKPLYLYMGESSPEAKYYVIDTDIEIDTDLSGGKDDDADNKGTASYRLGRPFQVPVGTKRATIMKLRILSADGKELGSRQIRVTRTFIAPLELVDTGTVENPDTVKEFNLSQEDKERLDRLSVLIKNVPEASRAALNRYIDQLGDIWYDHADRAETLLQFSNAVEQDSTLSPDLKERLLTQINLIYTQGQQDTEEKVLARKMIEDFLSKSPYKKQIFGDVPGEGLIDEIIDNPEYYEQNKSIAAKIFDEYVAIDTELSAEAKAVIKERLLVLVGDPLDPAINNQDPTEDPASEGDGSFMGYVKKYGVIAGSAIAIILGLLFLLALLRRNSGGSSMPDFPSSSSSPVDHDDHSMIGTHQDTSNDSHAVPSSGGHDDHDTTPDWLRESESPFGGEDVLSKSVAETAAHDDHDTTPDWAKDHTETPTPAPEPAHEPAPVAHAEEPSSNVSNDDVPDWLKGLHDEPETPAEPAPVTIPVPEEKLSPEATTVAEIPESTTPAAAESTTNDDDIPDWLRGAETMPQETPAVDTPPAESNTLFEEAKPETVAEGKSSEAPVNPVETTPSSTPSTASTTTDDDIPDWLRGAESEVAASAEVDTPAAPVGGLFEEVKEAEIPATAPSQPVVTEEVIATPLADETPKKENTQAPKKDKWKHQKHWKKETKTTTKATEEKSVEEKMKSDAKPVTKKPAKKKPVELLEPAHDLLASPTHEITPAHDLIEETPKKRKKTTGLTSLTGLNGTQNNSDNGNNQINQNNGSN